MFQNSDELAKAIDLCSDFALIATHPLLRPLAERCIFTVPDIRSCVFCFLCQDMVKNRETLDLYCVDSSLNAHCRAIARFLRFWHGIPFVPAYWKKMKDNYLHADNVIIGFRVSGAPTAVALSILFTSNFRVLMMPLKNGYAQNVPPLPCSLINRWCLQATVLDGEGKTLDATIFAHNAVFFGREQAEIFRTDFSVFLKSSSEQMRR